VGVKIGHMPRWKPESSPSGRNGTSFLAEMMHIVHHFCQQAKEVPCGRRRIGPFVQAHASFESDRVSPVTHRSYAIPPPDVDIASGRVEENILFFIKNLHTVQIFYEKRNKYHAAAGESGRYCAQTPSLQTHRVTPVNYTRDMVTNLEGTFASGGAEDSMRPPANRARIG